MSLLRYLLAGTLALPLFGQFQLPPPSPKWLPMRFANLPACPLDPKTTKIKPEADGSALLMRVQDPSGATLDVWCAREAAGFNYQYRARQGDSKSYRIDRCQIADGISSVGVDHEGDVVETPLENGGQWLKIRGKLGHFFADNWDSTSGHHSLFDFARQTADVFRTRAFEDGIGRWIRILDSAESFSLGGLPQTEIAAALGKVAPERKFDPARVNCLTALADEGMRIHTQELDAFLEPGKLEKVTVAWPESAPIQTIRFDGAKRELFLVLSPGARKTVVSVAMPRKLLGIGKEIAKVRLDGQFIPTDETITATHRTVRFRLENPAREALLTESGGFPFFMVSAVAIGGGVFLGIFLALLFRRKLPAVPADD